MFRSPSVGPKRVTRRHKSSGLTSVISDYTLGSQAKQRSQDTCAQSSSCTPHLHHGLNTTFLHITSSPSLSHQSHVLFPSCSILLTSSQQQTLCYCLSSSSPQVCHPFPDHPRSCCPYGSGRQVVLQLRRPGVHHRQLSLPHLL